MSYWFEEPHRSLDQLEKEFEKNIENKQLREFILKKDNERLGYVTIFTIDFIHRNAEFAIMIDPEHQGKGFANTATDLAIDYAFSSLNLHKLYLYVDEENEKAIHIYKKKGFLVEGILKEEFFVNGTYRNAVSMAIFRSNYVKSK